MNARSVPMARVPVLTEVVELPLRDVAPPTAADGLDPVNLGATAIVSPPLELPPAVDETTASLSVVAVADINEAQLTQRILVDVQRQVDLMLEFRLREALMPALIRATESIVKDARQELAITLKDVVTRAVSQELSRHRVR